MKDPIRDVFSAWDSYAMILFPQIPKTHMLYGELRRAFLSGAHSAFCHADEIPEIKNASKYAELQAWAECNVLPDAILRVNVLFRMIESVGGKGVKRLPYRTGQQDSGTSGPGPGDD